MENIVISDNKHYKAIASKLRATLGNTTQYKPSELPNAIASIRNVMNSYNQIESGAFLYNDRVEFVGNKMYPGICCGSNITSAAIPENITEISDCAFARSQLSSITLHDNITSFGENAFQYCQLEDIIFPANLTYIGPRCFNSCHKLTSIILPESLTTVGTNAFSNCDGLTSIVIPKNVTTIRALLSDCAKLKKVDILGNITSIDGNAFSSCPLFDTLIVRSNNVCTLSSTAFYQTPIDSGAGYIYVPSILIGAYKQALYWGRYPSQFRALEDYTVDGTITGALDETKI